ncbi:unnamed protein product [Trifolium pratense]|uniref:Uncharacterized protein n=1 Tax=Trifolium pratense TaxID=57577 RepID=A0ACB0KG21_TRIPR|nr:unnamed protein product [Trifolium pratense]
MDLETNCNCLSTINNMWSNYERIGNEGIVCVNEFVIRTKIRKLKKWWKKIKRERTIFRSSSPVFLYDPSSYLQNFDDGYSNDPDDFSRSFSARFAAPSSSKIFEKNIEVVDEDEILEINDES